MKWTRPLLVYRANTHWRGRERLLRNSLVFWYRCPWSQVHPWRWDSGQCVLSQIKDLWGTLAGSAGIPNLLADNFTSSMSMAKKATKRTWSVCRKNIKSPFKGFLKLNLSVKRPNWFAELNVTRSIPPYVMNTGKKVFHQITSKQKIEPLPQSNQNKSYCNSFTVFFVEK